MIADLFNVPTNQREWAMFSFANSDHHTQIVNSIFVSKSLLLPTYILDPIPPFDINQWLLRHQDIHNQENAQLGIPGNDLSIVNFQDRRQLQDWIWLHASEHVQVANILGIS